MVFFENNRFRYGATFFFRRHYVLDKARGVTARPTPEELGRLRAIFVAVRKIPLGAKVSMDRAEQNIYVGFCLSVHGEGEVHQIFMTQEPTVAAMVFAGI